VPVAGLVKPAGFNLLKRRVNKRASLARECSGDPGIGNRVAETGNDVTSWPVEFSIFGRHASRSPGFFYCCYDTTLTKKQYFATIFQQESKHCFHM